MFKIEFNSRIHEIRVYVPFECFQLKLGVSYLLILGKIGYYHRVHKLARSRFMCMDCMWDARIGRIDKKETRRRRRVSSSYYGRFRPFLVIWIAGLSYTRGVEYICTSWRPVIAGNATSGEARGGDCKIAVCPLGFWRW